MKVKVGANGKLFGSIASKDVADALLTQTGMEGVDRRKIEIPETIKSPGYIPLRPNCCRMCLPNSKWL